MQHSLRQWGFKIVRTSYAGPYSTWSYYENGVKSGLGFDSYESAYDHIQHLITIKIGYEKL